MPDQLQFGIADVEGDIEYSVRQSPRAKHVRLRVSPHEGLVVVVPPGFDTRQVPGIVRERIGWIQRAFEKMPSVHPRTVGVPEKLSLRSIGEEWSVFCLRGERERNYLEQRSGRVIEIHAVDEDPALQGDLLRAWVRRKAVIELLPRLEEAARQYGFRYNRGTVRHQKTRWGSCSTRGTISLNMKLLFLPSELVEYIFLHELCHTVHMNHSQSFWTLLERHMPDCRARDRAMRCASEYIPQFAVV